MRQISISLVVLKRRLIGDLIKMYKELYGEKILGTKGLFNLVEKTITSC